MPCTFKNADKKANDLFKRNFVSGHVVKTTVKTSTGVVFSTESKKASVNDASFATKLAAKFKDKASGFSVDKFEIDSQGQKNGPALTSEVSLKDPAVPNTKFTLKTIIANSRDWQKEAAEIGAEYSDDMWLASFKADPVNWTGAANLVVSAEGFLFGAEGTAAQAADAKPDDGNKFDFGWSALFGYHSGDFQGVMRCALNKKGTRTVDFTASQQYSSNLELATKLTANFDYLLADNDAADAVSFVTGGKYTFADSSTLAAQLGGDAKLKLCYAQKLFPSVKVSGCTEVNLATPDGKGTMEASTPMKFGFQLELGDI